MVVACWRCGVGQAARVEGESGSRVAAVGRDSALVRMVVIELSRDLVAGALVVEFASQCKSGQVQCQLHLQVDQGRMVVEGPESGAMGFVTCITLLIGHLGRATQVKLALIPTAASSNMLHERTICALKTSASTATLHQCLFFQNERLLRVDG
jgi:hypothetical protein